MKKLALVVIASLLSVGIWAEKLYLKSGAVNYPTENAVVAIWSWGGSSDDAWTVFQASETDGIYYTTLPSGRTGGKIVRWPNGTTPSWDNEGKAWNKTGDIAFPATYPATTDMIELNAWDGATSGTWTQYVKPEPAEDVTLYFVNSLKWATVKAFVWPATGSAYKEWSGEAMTKTETKVNGYDVYSYTFPSNYVNVIFNNGTEQTHDQAWAKSEPYFYPTSKSEEKYVGDWYATPGDIPAVIVPAKFYVTGDSALVVDAGQPAEKKWSTTAIKSEKDTLVLSKLKAGQYYTLKVTVDGTWETAKGFDELTEAERAAGLYKDKDNNICFTLASAGDVQVVYTNNLFKLIGDFYVKPIVDKVVKLVPSEEWLSNNAKFAAWTWGTEQEGKWSSFFTPIKSGNDTLKATIKTSADSIAFIRFSPKATEPTWDQAENTDVLIWGEVKDLINWESLTATVLGWDSMTWAPVAKSCESFGLVINGVYTPAKKNVLQTEWLEYVLRSVDLKAGDKLQVRDDCHDAQWVIEKYAATSFAFSIQEISEQKYYVVGSDGTYDFYLKFIPNNDEIYISKAGYYTQSVPTQCEDVLMQAFFNESYNDNAPGVSDQWNLGDTRWSTLTGQAEEISSYFDLIWLPPSANGDGMGYHPKNYGWQDSNWGSSGELDDLITALHNGGSKVVADIVINHCQSSNGWLGFPEFNFGSYGKFTPDASYVCKNDEVNLNPEAGSDYGKATGSYDDGENWEGARDWAHDMVKVQDMFKAYLQWMRNDMKYDGFRYDKGDGFNNWHHDNYNRAAGPYIAFMECYSNTDEIWGRIQGANYNLMALDFDTKWHVFDAIAGWDYNGKNEKARGDGLLGRNNGRYAVTFIDSHDWFLRPDNECEFGGRGNSLTEAMKPRLLQANAFLLCMPGVPCVFYPHWAKYKEFLKPMIEARKAARVHSESEVKDEYATSTGYQATIVGKDGGYIILCLGDKAHHSGFDGFVLGASYYAENDCGMSHDASYQIWVKKSSSTPTGTEEAETSVKAEKIMRNGQLVIRKGDRLYDVTGRVIQ